MMKRIYSLTYVPAYISSMEDDMEGKGQSVCASEGLMYILFFIYLFFSSPSVPRTLARSLPDFLLSHDENGASEKKSFKSSGVKGMIHF
jgi:hypothetical protein